ncbi:isochorismatase hydrolase [Catenulispora acidiphila DSM 44928]|uniref:Isochorismatase hydrolase n=1 Tax=Catenulispora acidiphila (strain DSM 44928 / JCM 14897 / NBRC 102108 / NRRL B-24433 / ID139908) TaxID=479433 RepID=C7PXU4_CATAD|nr:isochorismatase family cysteine hydrolase [Catenulispora acidiphila]ACU73404.1 isochorismatase hydrolase [Catenulispora acidiphila DSM 44928]
MSKTALIVIDVISTYEHEDGEKLVPSAREAVPAVQRLISRARDADADVIYVNDNFGRWNSNRDELLDTALRGPHADLVEPLRPDERSLFVLKARHSIFYQTPLEYLLDQLGARRIVLCGQVTEQCVMYSALDAHIRHLTVVVARDAVAHIDADLGQAALAMMERNMSAEILAADEIDFT